MSEDESAIHLREFRAPLLRIRRGMRVVFQAEHEAPPPEKRRPSRLAKDLALGHRLVAEVEQEGAEGFSALGRRLGLHPARVSILVSLTFLAPDLQAKLIGLDTKQSTPALKLRDWVSVSRAPDWAWQREHWAALCMVRKVIVDIT